MKKDVSQFQRECAEVLLKEPSGKASAMTISKRLGRTLPLAVTSAMAALQRKGYALCIGYEQRPMNLWMLTALGKAELQLQRAPAAAQ